MSRPLSASAASDEGPPQRASDRSLRASAAVDRSLSVSARANDEGPPRHAGEPSPRRAADRSLNEPATKNQARRAAPSPVMQTLCATDGIRRAWPSPDGSLSVELIDESHNLRAGRIEVSGILALTPMDKDRKLPALGAGLPLVVHRLHKRAVGLTPDRAIKILRPGRAPRVAAASTAVAVACAAAGFGAAEVLSSTDDVVEFSLLPGTTLYDLGRAGAQGESSDGLGSPFPSTSSLVPRERSGRRVVAGSSLAGDAQGAMEGWRALADGWPDFARTTLELPAHTSGDEIEVLRTWYGHALRFGSLDRLDELGAAVDEACEALAETPDPAVTLHRDLHDKQALWDGTQIHLLDLDTAARGEAALDLANLLVHVELRAMQGVLDRADDIAAILMGAVDKLEISAQRLAAYAQASRLRLAFLYSFRPASAPWLGAWTDQALTRK